MRSAAELRRRWLDRLPLMITRAGMDTTGGGAAFDTRLGMLVEDLCFLDEREHDRDRVHEVRRGCGKLGVVGPFMALFGRDGSYVAEVAPPTRLAYLSLIDFVPDHEPYEHLTTIDITPAGDRTSLVMMVEPLHDETWTREYRAYCGNELDNLDAAIGRRTMWSHHGPAAAG